MSSQGWNDVVFFGGGGASVSAATCVEAVAVPPFFLWAWRTANAESMDDRKHQKNRSLLASMLVPHSTPAS